MLNLTDGYSRSLTEKIVAFRKREDARNGIDADDHARKRKETAQAAIDRSTQKDYCWTTLCCW